MAIGAYVTAILTIPVEMRDSVYYMKAYQNGIELPNSYLSTVDTDTNIQSGMSIKVKDEFILRNTDDDIEVRVYKVKNNKEVAAGYLS